MLKTLALTSALQVDSGEDHRQLRGPQLHAGGFCRAGDFEASFFEPFVPDHQPVTIKVENLDPISSPVDEEKEMPSQNVLLEALLDQATEAVERMLP